MTEHRPGCVVDQGVLQQGAEHEEDADAGPDVDGLVQGMKTENTVYAKEMCVHDFEKKMVKLSTLQIKSISEVAWPQI